MRDFLVRHGPTRGRRGRAGSERWGRGARRSSHRARCVHSTNACQEQAAQAGSALQSAPGLSALDTGAGERARRSSIARRRAPRTQGDTRGRSSAWAPRGTGLRRPGLPSSRTARRTAGGLRHDHSHARARVHRLWVGGVAEQARRGAAGTRWRKEQQERQGRRRWPRAERRARPARAGPRRQARGRGVVASMRVCRPRPTAWPSLPGRSVSSLAHPTPARPAPWRGRAA
jgi:hypothetical protein